MTSSDPGVDRDLVMAIAAGDAAAAETFKVRHAAVLDRICGAVTPTVRAKAEAYGDLMRSDNLTALFSGFDGRSTWTTFVVAAVLNRFLFPRLLQRLARDPTRHAGEFEAFFRRDIGKAVRSTVPRRDLDQDAAQWIWEQLLDNDGEQLLKFADQAKTPGFVIVKLKRLAQDFLNSTAAPAAGRKRTMPDYLGAVPDFDKDVYKQFYWWRARSAAIAVLALRQHYPEATEAAVREARARIERILQAHGGLMVVERDAQTIDEHLIEVLPGLEQPTDAEEIERAAFRKALLAAAKTLTDREKLCLMKRLEGKAAGDIAEELGIARAVAYDLMREVVKKLRKTLSSNTAARERIATITGNDDYIEVGRISSESAKPRQGPT